MGSFFSRALLMAFGYAYPAYECFKSVEKKDPEIMQLLFWCHYWTIVALLTVFEKVGDPMFSWVPLYNEAKLAFFVYLWYPKTKGTDYVYGCFLKPFLMNHEKEIDQNIMELKLRTRNVALFYSQKVVIHGRTTFFDILQYFSLQSKLQTQTDQPNHKQLQSDSSKHSFSQKEHEQGGEAVIADGKESAETGSEVEETMTAAVSPSSSRHPCRRRSLLPFFSKLLGGNRGNGTSDSHHSL